MPFSGSDPYLVSGNASEQARIDTLVYEDVRVAGKPLSEEEVNKGIGELVSNVTVCETGCGNGILPPSSRGWSEEQICGRSPQPSINGTRLPPLTNPHLKPYCSSEHTTRGRLPKTDDDRRPPADSGEGTPTTARPSAAQLQLMDMGLAQFMHFSVDTFTNGVEHNCVGTRSDCIPATSFNPTHLDTDQWVQAALKMGAGEICLTAHHEGVPSSSLSPCLPCLSASLPQCQVGFAFGTPNSPIIR